MRALTCVCVKIVVPFCTSVIVVTTSIGGFVAPMVFVMAAKVPLSKPPVTVTVVKTRVTDYDVISNFPFREHCVQPTTGCDTIGVTGTAIEVAVIGSNINSVVAVALAPEVSTNP